MWKWFFVLFTGFYMFMPFLPGNTPEESRYYNVMVNTYLIMTALMFMEGRIIKQIKKRVDGS